MIAASLTELFGGYEVRRPRASASPATATSKLLEQESDDLLKLDRRTPAGLRQRTEAVRLEVSADAMRTRDIIASEELQRARRTSACTTRSIAIPGRST